MCSCGAGGAASALFERDGTLWAGMLAGALFGIEFLVIFIGLDYTSVARSTLLVNTMPFWTLHRRPSSCLASGCRARKFAGLLLAFGGLVLVFSDKLSLPGPDALLGDLLSLAAGLAWAATMHRHQGLAAFRHQRRKAAALPARRSRVWSRRSPCLSAARRSATPTPSPPGRWLFQAVYVVAITYVLWFWLVQRYPASGLSSFTFLTPVFGVLFGGLILGEPLGTTIFLALGLIVAGLVLVNRSPRQPVP